jgi:hypothetical protein
MLGHVDIKTTQHYAGNQHKGYSEYEEHEAQISPRGRLKLTYFNEQGIISAFDGV